MPSRSTGLTTADLRRTRRQPPQPLRTRKLDATETRTAGNVLEKARFATIDRRQNERIQYGRSLDLDVIDTALQRAARGNMLPITDIGRETLRLDGHLSGIVNKRLNRAGAIDWNVVANDGSGRRDYDRGRARDRAEFVKAQLLQIPDFHDSLRDIMWAVWDNRSCLEIPWSIGTGAEAGDSKLFVGWRPRELCWIHPRRLSFNQQRRVVITDDYDPGYGFQPKGFPIQQLPEKFITTTPRLYNDYPELEGLSIRAQYWSFFQRLGTRERIILVEVFGAPWRLAYSEGDDTVGPSDDVMREAFGTLQNMSSRNAAWMPHGVKPYFFTPPPGSGQTHKELIEDARFVLSKLVLGQTSSTDAVPTGLGSSIADTQLTEEDLIIASDLRRVAGVIEHQLTDRIIELNYGPEELIYAPLFQFEIKGQVDRVKETERLDKTLRMGVPVALEEIYEVTGYRQPRQGEPVMSLVADDSGLPGAEPRLRIVYAPKKAPPPGELAIEPAEAIDINATETDTSGLVMTPSSLEAFVKVNEARAAQQLPPLTLPDGTPDPDGNLTVAAYKAKMEAKQATVGENQGDLIVPPTKQPGPPALPPKPGVEDSTDDQGPDGSPPPLPPPSTPPEEPVEAADKREIIIPYTSPSGLSDAERELLKVKGAKSNARRRKR